MAGRSFLRRRVTPVIASALAGVLLVAGCISQADFDPSAASAGQSAAVHGEAAQEGVGASTAASLGHDPSLVDFPAVPDYSGDDYVEVNGGEPFFTEADKQVPEGTEVYGELDAQGRATYAFAKLCANTRPKPGSHRNQNMPDPSGFVQAFYPEAGLDHLYERSHLIAYSLNDEAVNPRDLITGTRHLNQQTMQPFEQAVRSCIEAVDEATGEENHVLMRVTPDFRGDELVARGVLIEALSLEDDGQSVRLNVYCYNVQPGVQIDYATGESRLAQG